MNLEYKHLIPDDFPDDARVWIYQCNRLFSLAEALQLEEMLESFVRGWQSHGAPVRGFATLFFGRFIILMADESVAGVSGCSTDGSVRMVKSVEERFGVSLFDRQTLAFVVKGRIELLPMGQLDYALGNGFLTRDTVYFNNLVQDRRGLLDAWMVPVGDSWLAARLRLPA